MEVRKIISKKDLKEFIFLPEKLHKDHDTWITPIYSEEWSYFNPDKNRAFEYSETTLYLAYKDGEAVGRIMGIINKRSNEKWNEKIARFTCFECINDQEVAHELFSKIECWAKEKGMNKLIGPFGFSGQDPEGYLIEGYDQKATISTFHNFPFINDLIEKEGFSKDVDYLVYKIDIPNEIPEFYHKIKKRITRSGEFVLHEFTRRKEIKPWVRPLFHLMNETYSDLYGYSPIDEEEMDNLYNKYVGMLDPRFLKLVTRKGELVSFVVGIPDMSEGIKKAKGRLYPFGIFHILRSAKRTIQLDLLLGAVKEDVRGRGLDVLMGFSMLESAKKAGFEYLDTHNELESNTKVRAEMERMGGVVYKKLRVYQKKL
jgi:hypothetical protein